MNTSLSRITVGIAIIILGLGFMLDSLGLIGFGELLGSWWPMFVIVAGVAALLGSPRQPIVPAIILIAGVLLQLRTLDIVEFNVFGLIWPAILIGVGVSILFNRSGSQAATVKSDSTDMFAFLGGAEVKSKSVDYDGGKVTAILGGATIDLRDAKLKDSANLEMTTFMGGIELKVPKDWRVNVSGTPLLGGWEDKTEKPASDKAPTLNVRAMCALGGIEIKN